VSGAIEIRRQLRPGGLGEIVALHGRLYGNEYGVDSSFEGFVASSIARAAIRGWPGEREGVWLVERDGALRGCIAYTDEGDDVAMLRWFVLEAGLRGRGLGRGLIGELIEEVRAHGFARIHLETFSDLQTAARIYRRHGFEVVSSETGPRWGRDEITYQHYELDLAASQSTSTTDPPRRGSPPPARAPSGFRATA
jgi:GNAT superfamily N-acetyltransferase